MLTEEKIEEVESHKAYLRPVSYMDAHVLKLENSSKWAEITIAHLWMPYATMSQPADDGFIYKDRFLVQKGRSSMLLKRFP